MTAQRHFKPLSTAQASPRLVQPGGSCKEQHSLQGGSLCFQVVPGHQSTLAAHPGVTLGCHRHKHKFCVSHTTLQLSPANTTQCSISLLGQQWSQMLQNCEGSQDKNTPEGWL